MEVAPSETCRAAGYASEVYCIVSPLNIQLIFSLPRGRRLQLQGLRPGGRTCFGPPHLRPCRSGVHASRVSSSWAYTLRRQRSSPSPESPTLPAVRVSKPQGCRHTYLRSRQPQKEDSACLPSNSFDDQKLHDKDAIYLALAAGTSLPQRHAGRKPCDEVSSSNRFCQGGRGEELLQPTLSSTLNDFRVLHMNSFSKWPTTKEALNAFLIQGLLGFRPLTTTSHFQFLFSSVMGSFVFPVGP